MWLTGHWGERGVVTWNGNGGQGMEKVIEISLAAAVSPASRPANDDADNGYPEAAAPDDIR